MGHCTQDPDGDMYVAVSGAEEEPESEEGKYIERSGLALSLFRYSVFRVLV